MKEYNQYCDEQVNQNNEMEMLSRTEQNPNSRIRLEQPMDLVIQTL